MAVSSTSVRYAVALSCLWSLFSFTAGHLDLLTHLFSAIIGGVGSSHATVKPPRSMSTLICLLGLYTQVAFPANPMDRSCVTFVTRGCTGETVFRAFPVA